MISEGIVRGTQALLARFGIFSRVRLKADRRGNRKDCWSLTIRSLGDRIAFANEIGFIDPTKEAKLDAESRDRRTPGRQCEAARDRASRRTRRDGRLRHPDRERRVPEREPSGAQLLHPLRRGPMDSILNWYVEEGDHLQGGLGGRGQPVEHPLLARAAQGRRHGVGPGQLHAWCRRLGRDDQVGWQDPARRQDGHPQRRPPRHRGLHLVQGDRGAQGPGPARRRVRHGPRRG